MCKGVGEDFVLLVKSNGEVVDERGTGEDLCGEGDTCLRLVLSLEEVFTDRSIGSSWRIEPLEGLGVESMLGENAGVE